MITVSTDILSRTTAFKIDDINKCFFKHQHINMMF